MTQSRAKDLQVASELVKLVCFTYAPGDGKTRYRFAKKHFAEGGYFGCRSLYTAMGIAEAETWLSGYVAAWQPNHN